MKLFFLLFSSLLATLPLNAESVKVKNHRYPVQESVFGEDWTLVGTHHFKFKVLFSVFTGGYYQTEEGGERLVFTYTRNIKADDLRKQADNHLLATQSTEVLEKYAEKTAAIQAAYVDVTKNSSYAITVIPDQGITLARDGEVVFQSDDAEFGDWYLDIWLGDPPIDQTLKDALTNS